MPVEVFIQPLSLAWFTGIGFTRCLTAVRVVCMLVPVLVLVLGISFRYFVLNSYNAGIIHNSSARSRLVPLLMERCDG